MAAVSLKPSAVRAGQTVCNSQLWRIDGAIDPLTLALSLQGEGIRGLAGASASVPARPGIFRSVNRDMQPYATDVGRDPLTLTLSLKGEGIRRLADTRASVQKSNSEKSVQGTTLPGGMGAVRPKPATSNGQPAIRGRQAWSESRSPEGAATLAGGMGGVPPSFLNQIEAEQTDRDAQPWRPEGN